MLRQVRLGQGQSPVFSSSTQVSTPTSGGKKKRLSSAIRAVPASQENSTAEPQTSFRLLTARATRLPAEHLSSPAVLPLSCPLCDQRRDVSTGRHAPCLPVLGPVLLLEHLPSGHKTQQLLPCLSGQRWVSPLRNKPAGVGTVSEPRNAEISRQPLLRAPSSSQGLCSASARA